jgi:hypothetical protein
MIFDHPNPRLHTLQERGAAVLAAVMLIAALLSLLIAFNEPRLILMVGVSIVLVLLATPVLMVTAASPALEVTDEALVLHSRVWPRRAVPWSRIRAITPHPLLPPPDSETLRRAAVGRTNYQPARGVLIIVPSLPLPYRFSGLFAGQGFTGALALTSRTHARYDAALSEIEQRLAAALQSAAPEP